MGRVTKGTDMNAAMDHHHEEDEGDPNRAVGEEEAAGEIGTEEGIGTGTGETDREILVGRSEAGGVVVLGGVNALGHEKFPRVPISMAMFFNFDFFGQDRVGCWDRWGCQSR